MKRIAIINGMTDNRWREFEDQLKAFFDQNTNELQCEIHNIREMDIHYCCGCWSCWVKTPGLCSQKDEMPKILKSFIQSDLVLFLSPISMGFVSANIKKVNDKLIPLVHPYITLYKGECHHRSRYAHFPKLGLVLVDENTKNNPSEAIITQIYKRLAINMRSDLAFSLLTNGNIEEVAYAINHF